MNATATLSQQVVRRLAIYRAVYALTTEGFSPAEARRLVFYRWAVACGRLGRG